MALAESLVKRLIEAAKAASTQAYSPYSAFPVGAAVVTEGGIIFAGCNVENASYGLTICAERSAIFQAVAQGKRQLQAIVVYTPTRHPTAPCGACRQVINEFGPHAEVISVCDGSEVLRSSLLELLPNAFGPHNLREGRRAE